MREKRVFKVFVLALLLCSSWQVANGGGQLRSVLRGEVGGKVASLSQPVFAALLSLGLLGTVALTADAHEVPHAERHAQRQHLYQAELQATAPHSYSMSGNQAGPMQGWQQQLGAEDEEDNALAWSEAVTYGSSVFYLALRNDEYEHVHHVVYVGDTSTGEPLFAGLFLVGHEEDYIRLYAEDGLVAQGFKQTDVKIFPDPLDLYAQVHVFTIKDIFLTDRYKPVVPEFWPTAEVGEELEMAQYGKREDDPESHENLPLRQRSCKLVDQLIWGELGIIRHNCAPLEEAHSSFGAPIFDPVTRKMVNFYSETTPAGASLSEGMTQELVEYILGQQVNPTAVDSKDKLAVTWAALKQAQ